MHTIDITGLDKAAVLAALWSQAPDPLHGLVPVGLPDRMSLRPDQAAKIVADSPDLYFDYVCGRCLKVDLSKDELDVRPFDRDAGRGAALRALTPLLGPDRVRQAFQSEPSFDNLAAAIAAKLNQPSDDDDR